MKHSKFHTEVIVPEFEQKTGYKKANMFLGSCFTENIGTRMAELKYNTDINPFGILYNPVSVANGLQILVQNKEFTKDDLIYSDGLFHSFYHHGRFSDINENEVLERINYRIHHSSEFLKNANFLFLTFGTSWIYRYIKTGKVVSNCHKISAKEFVRERLSINEIVEKYQQLLKEIIKLNPALKIVFTVSPVRHWKDGAVENQRSKSTLLLAIEELIGKFEKGFINYFPAYEIMMDELRDYRFYAEDMIHIADTAVSYIWEKFEESLIDKESQQTSKQVLKIIKAINHRPFNKNTKEHLSFLQKLKNQIELFSTKVEYLNFEIENKHCQIEIDKIEKVLA